MTTARIHFSVFTTMAALLCTAAAEAQTLDSEYQRLLSNNCAALGHDASGDDPDFGPGIDVICQIPASGAGGSAGGNAAASNSAGVTVETRREVRLDSEDEDPTDTLLGGGVNLFVTADYERLNRHRSTFEDGFQSDVWRGTLGADLLVHEDLLVGAFFSYANNSGDYRSGGDFSTDSYSPTLFASMLPIPEVFVDVSLSYTRHQYDRDRAASYTRQGPPTTFSGAASSDPDGDQVGVTLAAGYDHVIDNITIGPRAGLNYDYQHIENYRESGSTGLELAVRDQYISSLQSVFGLEATVAISTPFGVLIPRVAADYVHEFLNDQRDIRVSFVQDLRAAPQGFSFENQDPDRDFARVSAGAVLALPNGYQPFVNFRTMLGNSYFEHYVTTIGVRLEL